MIFGRRSDARCASMPSIDQAAVASLASLQRRRRHRRIGVAAVVLIAIIDLLSALRPRTTSELAAIDQSIGLAVSFTARLALAILGSVVVLVLRGIGHGQHRAWGVAVVVGLGSVTAQVLNDGTLTSAVVCMVATLVLAIDRASYRVPGRGLRPQRLAVPIAAAAVAYAALGLLEHSDGLADLSVVGRAEVIVRGLAFLPQSVAASTPAARAFLSLLRIAGALVSLGIAWSVVALVRPSRSERTATAGDVRFFADHGRTSAAPLASLPGNHVVRLTESTRVGGRFAAGAMVAVGPPATMHGDNQGALAEFVKQCELWGAVPAIVDADELTASIGRPLGFTALKIGEEAYIDLAGFSVAGKALANVRHSATRAARDGTTVLHYDAAARTPSLDRDLMVINDAWLATKHGPELGFTLGHLNLDRIDQSEMYVAVDPAGTAVAFTTWLPYDAGRGVVLDLMRRGDSAPPGVMELLITEALTALPQLGYLTASLGGVPLASTTAREGAIQRAMEWMYENAGQLYEAKGLFAFKRKFDPRWEPMYLLYPTGTDLARILAAIGRAFLPDAPKLRRPRPRPIT